MQRLKVTIVKDDGYAKSIGLEANDILLSIGNQVLETPESLTSALATFANTKTTLRFFKSGREHSILIQSPTLGVVVVPVEYEDINAENQLNAVVAGMIISTAPSIEGYRITQTIDVITSECVFGLNFFKDFFTAVTDFFGGRSNTAQSALRDARKTCLNELKKEAASLGANAIIGIDLDYSEFSGQGKSMLFLVASGTAVCIEPIPK